MILGDELLAEFASSVLANIKPSNLFTVSNSYYDVDGLIACWNDKFNSYDIYFRKVSQRQRNTSILVYRWKWLNECINSCPNRRLLEAYGYEPANFEGCIDCMATRLAAEDFPHEIGVFLGYPYEDVVGFIENKGRNFLCSGYWKVYENEKDKRKTFDLYKKTRIAYINAVKEGADIEELIAV